MKNQLNFLNVLIIFSLYTILIHTSCSKDKEKDINLGPATLSVKLSGILTETEGNLANNFKENANIKPKVLEFPINNNLSAYVSLEEDSPRSKDLKNRLNNKFSASEITPITSGVKYGILVYFNNTLVANGHKIFTAGQEDLEDGFALDGGKSYTFIGYSRNSSLSIPSITDINDLSTAKIEDESEDLLYFRHEQTLNTGNNILNVNLKHKFTLVTTQIKVGTEYGGVINALSNGSFNKVRESASLKLIDGDIAYSNIETSSEIEFDAIPSGGVKTISSYSNLLIGPSSTNIVTYSFPAITINDTTAAITPLYLNMQAGKKYNLILTFDVPCKIEEFYFNNYEQYSEEIDSMDASYYRLRNDIPLKINFTKVDNNFNVFYNEKPLFEARYHTVTLKRSRTFSIAGGVTTYSAWSTWIESDPQSTSWVPHDADFQNAGGGSSIRTMRFVDGTYWGAGSIDEIYNLNGTAESPIIRLTISETGAVSISGNKSPGGIDNQTNIEAISSYNYTYSGPGFPTDAIYNSTPIVSSTVGNEETETIHSIRKSMDFKMNTSLPLNSNGKDNIRVKQSTKSMFPQGGEGPTQLRGLFSPTIRRLCD